jgi:hypothetical protein
MITKYLEKLLNAPSEFTPPPVEVQRHVFQKKVWYVDNLIALAQTMPAFEKPITELRAVILESAFPGMGNWTYAELAYHTRVAIKADLQYPILLGEDGRVLDGHHRLLKALIDGHPTIKAVQFVIDPEPDEYLD